MQIFSENVMYFIKLFLLPCVSYLSIVDHCIEFHIKASDMSPQHGFVKLQLMTSYSLI